MLLGGNTYREMVSWFTNQTPIVISRDQQLEVVNHGYRVSNLEAAVELAENNEVDELVVSGGAEIYELALPLCDQMILTRVLAEFPIGNRFFPKFDTHDWKLQHREDWPSDSANAYSMHLEIYHRRQTVDS